MIMGSVSPDRLGTGGAILALSRSVGVVTSVAVMGAVFAGRLESHEIALLGQSTVGVAAQSQAFILAFRDTYMLAGILSALGVFVSFAYWPQLVKIRAATRRGGRPAD